MPGTGPVGAALLRELEPRTRSYPIMRTVLYAPAAALLGLAILGACGTNMQQRAATGAATGLIVAGPVGAAVGAAAGAVVNEVEEDNK
jgi:hypothetical protein